MPESNSKHTKLFGTDGIRGRANAFPMTSEIALKVGQAMGVILESQPLRMGKRRTVLIGKDTRISGYMIEQALASGLNSMGIHVQLTGPLPTPGIGFLASNMRVDAGIVISASHNNYEDNGIKIFGSDGYKIPDEWEQQIEELVYGNELESHLVNPTEIGRTRRIDDAAGRYIVYAKNAFPLNLSLDGLRIVLDCAHGAAYKVAPAIFRELGAEVIVMGNEPSGFNINDKFGALYPKRVSEAVLNFRADIGITLDGDADRVILVDNKGHLVNGDHILSICALDLKENKKLKNDTIVATQMSNFGLDKRLSKAGIKVVRTGVGDKNVVEEMRKNDYILGGEQSGHIIFMDHSTTGDGCVAALNVLAVMQRQKKALSELNEELQDFPQVLINTKVKVRKDLNGLKDFQKLKEEFIAQLGEDGRIFVRFSGTEPLVRVLVEGLNKQQITEMAERLSEVLQSELS
ncbi:MAG: phosphoglucosamine mutase [Bdellovibrionales bacterium]|nr:phosphoglucosamine mutase [Bdellovibrionales bacterium]